jgi:hypothetical protein
MQPHWLVAPLYVRLFHQGKHLIHAHRPPRRDTSFTSLHCVMLQQTQPVSGFRRLLVRSCVSLSDILAALPGGRGRTDVPTEPTLRSALARPYRSTTHSAAADPLALHQQMWQRSPGHCLPFRAFGPAVSSAGRLAKSSCRGHSWSWATQALVRQALKVVFGWNETKVRQVKLATRSQTDDYSARQANLSETLTQKHFVAWLCL